MRKKEGIYIARIDEKYELDFGVSKKINGQLSAFKELGYNMDYLRVNNKVVKLNDSLHTSIKYRYFAYKEFYKLLKEINLDKYSFAYLRYVKGCVFFYKTLRLLKII